MEFTVGAVFQSWGYLKVEAENKEELLKKLNDRNYVDSLSLPDFPEYVDESFEIDFDGLNDLNGGF